MKIRRWVHLVILAWPVASREEIDEKVALARLEGVLRRDAQQSGAPVGYWAFFADPDGNTLELSYGQQIGLEIITARNTQSLNK